MRVTADTNFLISATQWNYSLSRKLLTEILRRKIDIFTTKEILEEFSNVLIRDFNLNLDKIKEIIINFLGSINMIETSSKVDIVKHDPDDNKVIECAVDSKSDYILTYDKHLLSVKEFKGIKIVKPEEFFKIINTNPD
ncbi:putative toxin-antitoxin system toxin component, PIN family [Candidatus Pacearchaeota archaeon]|nr:putative toxin-antitoxin system toxin component, PIN family [Candidatus Pacearchaeota archaeon]